jgi:hypothetical protein
VTVEVLLYAHQWMLADLWVVIRQGVEYLVETKGTF